MTIEVYRYLLDAQGGGCAICHKPVCTTGRALSVDHCHETGNIRGLLCMHCNMLIGYADDSPDRLRAAISYLEN